MKKLLTICLTLCLILGLAACGSSSSNNEAPAANPLDEALLTSGKIIVGTSPDYPPFESLNAAGEVEGFEVDLLNGVMEVFNQQNGSSYTVELKQMDFSTIISALQANQIDVGMSGFTYSPERDCIFTTPHLVSRQVIVTREDTGINGPDDLVGKKVAAGTGTTGAEALAEVIGEENVLYPGDYTVMYQSLAAGQLDAVVSDEAVGDNYVKEFGLKKCETPLVNEEMSFIIKTGNTVLADAFNKALEEYMKTDAYKALLDKYGL